MAGCCWSVGPTLVDNTSCVKSIGIAFVGEDIGCVVSSAELLVDKFELSFITDKGKTPNATVLFGSD